MGRAIEEVPPIRPCWQIMGTKAIILVIIILSIVITIIITMVRRPSAGWAKVVGNHMNGLIQQENHKLFEKFGKGFNFFIFEMVYPAQKSIKKYFWS